MWFGGNSARAEQSARYSNAIEPGVALSGYHAIRADQTEHNEYIMDQILADIRRAPFVVADLTSQNQGVYYEAGFARGLGLPVVYTCCEQDFEKLHFDVSAISIVKYATDDELKDRLANRILGSIGPGPLIE